MLIKVSVVIPVYNDPSGLQDTLESLVAQNFPKDQYEIIVVDNGSTDKTLDVAKMHADKYPQLVKYVIEDKIQSSYAARNKGIDSARGELISFVDADMTVSKDWIRQIISVIDENNPDYVGCKVYLYSKRKSFATLYNIVTGFQVKSAMEDSHYAQTCCLTVKSNIFSKIGFFDNRLESGGDWEFGNRAWDARLKFHYTDKITIYHPARDTLKALLMKSIRIGRGGRGQLSCLYPERYKDFNNIYLSWRRYVPRNPYLIRGQYRCGYSFKTVTVLMFWIFPVLSHYFSLIGFIQSKIYFYFSRN